MWTLSGFLLLDSSIRARLFHLWKNRWTQQHEYLVKPLCKAYSATWAIFSPNWIFLYETTFWSIHPFLDLWKLTLLWDFVWLNKYTGLCVFMVFQQNENTAQNSSTVNHANLQCIWIIGNLTEQTRRGLVAFCLQNLQVLFGCRWQNKHGIKGLIFNFNLGLFFAEVITVFVLDEKLHEPMNINVKSLELNSKLLAALSELLHIKLVERALVTAVMSLLL